VASEPVVSAAYCKPGPCIVDRSSQRSSKLMPTIWASAAAQRLRLGISVREELEEPGGDQDAEHEGFPIREKTQESNEVQSSAPSSPLPQQMGKSCDDWDLDFVECAPPQKKVWRRSAVRRSQATKWGRASSYGKRRASRLRRKSGPRKPHTTSAKLSLGRERPFLLIFFHGNATDIGLMMSLYHDISLNLCVDVLGVEYSGYGAASGQPCPDVTMQVADAAYNYAKKTGVPPSRILLYGQSIGSGPASGIAKRQPVAGVILHSPFLSGIQVLDRSPERCCKPSCMFSCCDFFHNDYAVRSVRCPVFIMHGQDDAFIPLWHGVRLRAHLPKEAAWPAYFPEEACHNDLVDVDPETYYCKLRAFVKSIKEGQAGSAALTEKREIRGEMATSEGGEHAAVRPAQVAMVSVKSGGVNKWSRRPKQPGDRRSKSADPLEAVAARLAKSDRSRTPTVPDHIRTPTIPGSGAGHGVSPGPPLGQLYFGGTAVLNSYGVALGCKSTVPLEVVPQTLVGTGLVESDIIVRNHRHMRTQPGSLSPGVPCGNIVFSGAAAHHRSRSADPLEVLPQTFVATGLPRHDSIMRNQHLMRTQSPMQPGRVSGHGKPPSGPCGRIVAADHRSKSDPLNAALARADQTILGQARSPLIHPGPRIGFL